MKFKNKSLLKVAALSTLAAFSFGLAISCVSNHKQNINKVFAEDDISTTWSYNSTNKALSCTYASNYPNGFIMETNQEAVRGIGDGEFELSYHVLGYPDNSVHPEYTDYGVFTLTFSGNFDPTASDNGPYGTITGYPIDISGLDGGTEYEIYIKVEPTGDMNQQGSESIYYNNGEFYSVDGGDNDPLVLSSIKFYGDITYENGSADLVFNNTGGDNVGTLRMSSINFYPKPDGDGTSYSGNISGTIASTGAQVEDYSCNSEAIFQHEEVFDPNSVTWDWDDSARVYTYDFSASTGIITYKALFLPPSIASGEDQIICEYTQGSLIANVRTTIYNHNNGDPIETGMTKSFEFPLASEPSLSGDSYEFQFGTTVLYTFSIDAIYVRIVDPGSAYDYGWTYEEENQKLVYYDPDYGVYTLVRGINNVMDQVVTLTYESPEGENPSQTMTIDIDFSGGTGGYDYSANTVSGYARLQGESSTAEFITVLLKNKDGNIINLNGANTWGFDGTIIIWINASSNAVPIDDLKDNMTGSTFYLAEGTSNQYCEIHYTYDGRELPTLTINRATYEEHELDDNEGVEYIVSGIFERLEESTVTVTIPGEHWAARPLVSDYVVSFDANGGQGQMEPESVTPPSDGGSVSYPLPECPFTKDGCNFVGWGITSATSDTIQPGENFDLSGDQTFYAIWSESTREYTFNITFQDGDATGGSMEDVTITSSTYEYEYTLPTCGYEKEGYEFAGWIYLSSGTSKIYQPGDTCTLDCDLTNTFLATWSAGEFVTITFNANGGEGTMEPITVENGSIQTVPGCDFTYEGYDFVEWAVGSPTSPTTFKPGESVTVSDNYTLYAVWEQKTSPTPTPTPTPSTEYDFRITFKGNGATGGRMSPINCKKGETKTVPGCDFIRDGYVFAGWAVDSLDSQTIIQPGQSFEINKDYTLYATWEKRVVEWRYIDMELCWYDSANPEDWAEPTKAVYYSGATEQEDLIFVTYSIYRFEANDEMGDDVAPTVVRDVTIVLKNVNFYEQDEYVNISGIFAEVSQEINVTVLAENFEIGETEGRNITPAQEAEIRENIPVDQNEKVEEALVVLPDETATEIISVIGSTSSAIDQDESLTPEEKEAAYNSVKKAVEASVVVGAQQATATEEGEAINDVLPENATIDMSNTLNEFYERQMDILLGRTSGPNRSILHRAPNNEENTIDYTIPEEDYGKMISYVDNSVENMTDAALQLRNCSGIEMIAVVETYIQKVLVSSFREFDKEAADEEFVAQAYESIMKTMQLQVIEILEKEHQPSNNPEKEAQYNETLEAVKDYETFEQMVIEVLRQKYVSATGNEVDIDTFEGMYMDIFRAWALDMPELNPHGITLEELTNATIEVTTNKANHMTFNAKFSKGENIFLIVFGSVTALSIAGAIAVPTILKKKREGVSK